MNGDIGLLTLAVMLMFIGGSGIGHGVTSLRCSVTRDPVWDAPFLFIGIVLVFLGCWIAAQTLNAPLPLAID